MGAGAHAGGGGWESVGCLLQLLPIPPNPPAPTSQLRAWLELKLPSQTPV